jgi:hypothetical protein
MYDIKRHGFAMILAIFVVILIAMAGTMLLSNTSTTGKASADNYVKAQAELLAKSATEFAVMRAQGFDTSGGRCLENLNITVQNATAANTMYDINVSIGYSFRSMRPNAAGVSLCSNAHVLDENTSHPTMMLIDVSVAPHSATSLSTEPLKTFTRTWQPL